MTKDGSALGFGTPGGGSFKTTGESDGRGSRDERFVQVAGEREHGWRNNKNIFAILPPFSNYYDRYMEIKKEAEEKGETPKYPIGAAYTMIRVKSFHDKHPRAYRVDETNHVTVAWRMLYDHLKTDDGKLTEDLKLIGNHMGGFVESRVVLNIMLQEDPSMLRWFDCPADAPWKATDYENGRLMTKIAGLVMASCSQTPHHLPCFDLDENVPIEMALPMNKSKENKKPIPQFHLAMLELLKKGDGLNVVNLRPVLEKKIANWSEGLLDAAQLWVLENDHDSLPDLTEIPNLMANGRACEILGLSTKNAVSKGSQVSTSVPVESTDENTGNSAPVTKQAEDTDDPFSSGSAGQPSSGPGPAPGKKASVSEAVSTFDQDKSKAEAAFSKQLDEAAKEAAKDADEAPPSIPDEDEPPF